MSQKTINLHFEDAVPLPDAGLLSRAMVQHGADMLQGGVKLAVDAPQLAALAHLAAHVEPKTCVCLIYRHHPRPVQRHSRFVVGYAAAASATVFDRYTIGHVLTERC